MRLFLEEDWSGFFPTQGSNSFPTSWVFCIGRLILYQGAAWEAQVKEGVPYIGVVGGEARASPGAQSLRSSSSCKKIPARPDSKVWTSSRGTDPGPSEQGSRTGLRTWHFPAPRAGPGGGLRPALPSPRDQGQREAWPAVRPSPCRSRLLPDSHLPALPSVPRRLRSGRRCGSWPLTTHFLPRKVKRDSFSCGVSSRNPTLVILRGGGGCCWQELMFRWRSRKASVVSSCEWDKLPTPPTLLWQQPRGQPHNPTPQRGQSNQAGTGESTRRTTWGRLAPTNVREGGARGHAPSGRD